MIPAFARLDEDGVAIAVRLTPKSSRDAIDGEQAGADGRAFLAARVRAIPEDGKANKALEKLLAKSLGVAKSSVTVIAGHTSRLKTVRISCEQAEREAMVEKLSQL